MEFSADLYGSLPIIKKYQVATSTTAVGQPWLACATSTAGLAIATTTGAADMVGVNLDSATYTTTQGTGKALPQGTSAGTSAERLVSIIINPFAIWRLKMSGGATENTALAKQTVTTASSGGTAITTGATWTSGTEYADGVTWGFTGANAGAIRKITSTSSTAGTVAVPFDYGTVVGDVFLRAPYWPMSQVTPTIQLTTLLTQANAIISVNTGASFHCYDLLLRDGSSSPSGQTDSYVFAIAGDHLLVGVR